MSAMRKVIIPTVALSAMLVGCGGSSNGASNNGGGLVDYNERQLDATHNTEYVYLNLDNDEVLSLSESQAQGSEDWHIAFRRFAVKFNGGASGPAKVVSAIGAAQEDFYGANSEPVVSVFSNALPENQLNVFAQQFAEPAAWVSDRVVTLLSGPSNIDGGWYQYNPQGGVMTANSDNGWLIRSGEGNSYARFRAEEIDFPTRTGEGVKSFEFSFSVQVENSDQFTDSATFTGSIPASGGELCFDFDADAKVACTGSAWDIKLAVAGRDFYMRSNGGVSGEGEGAVLGPFEWSDLSTWTSATIEPAGTSVASRYQEDVSSGIFDQYDWYAYDLMGMHRLWPNYRVYLVDTDSTDIDAPRYAVQITGYYDATGAGGHPRVRWRRIN